MPVLVGVTSHWSFTRALHPLTFGAGWLAALVYYELSDASADDWALWLAVAVLAVPGIWLVAYGIFHLYGSINRRASDIVFAPDGVEVEGGVAGGLKVPWEQLEPPYARVETRSHTRFSVFRPIRPLLGRLLGLASSQCWSLWLVCGQTSRLVAKADRAVEARAMEAARDSIVATARARRYVAEEPAVPARVLLCPSCGAPAIPDTADAVPCRHCGATVPVDAEMRAQAAGSEALAESREHLSKVTRRLMSQPRSTPTNARLAALWLLMLLSMPASVALFILYDTYRVREMVWGLNPWLLWLVTPVVAISAGVIGRAALVNRVAMHVLTLGFGALKPAYAGDKPRCRRCHGTLCDAEVAGVIRCGYCQSDNVAGVDLRPAVDKARAERKSLDEVIRAHRLAKALWGGAAVIALLVIGATFATSAAAVQHLVPMTQDLVGQQQRSADTLKPPIVDIEGHYNDRYRARVAGYLENPNDVVISYSSPELTYYDEDGKRVHTEEVSLYRALPPGSRVPFSVSSRHVEDFARIDIDAKTGRLRQPSSPWAEIEILDHEFGRDEDTPTASPRVRARVRNQTPYRCNGATLYIGYKSEDGELLDVNRHMFEPSALGPSEEASGSFRVGILGERGHPADVGVWARCRLVRP